LQYKAQSQIAALPVNWLVGYDYDLSTELRQAGAAQFGEKVGVPNRNEDNQATNNDLFLQGTALLSDAWSLVAGMRHSQVELQSDDHYLSNGNGSGTIGYGQTSPVLGVTFHASDRLNVFASYGKGFESPTLAEVAYNGAGVPAFNTSIKASSSKHFELGAKWLPTSVSRVDFSVFQIKSTDEIVVSSSSGGNSTYKNAPGTDRTGWEFSGRTLLKENISLALSASQIDATYSEAFVSSSAVTAGNYIPGIPQYFMFSELLWSQSPMNVARKGPVLGSQAGLELTRAGRLYANDTNTASAEGYTTLNFKASHAWKMGGSTFTAFARIDNLTDEKYVGSVIVNQATSRFYEPAPGRNWSLGLRVSVPL
jgi:iron complex outermembrane receptor protein